MLADAGLTPPASGGKDGSRADGRGNRVLKLVCASARAKRVLVRRGAAQRVPPPRRPSGRGVLICVSELRAIVRRGSGKRIRRIDPRDLALLTVASHKAARVVTKDRVTSAVRAPFTRWFATVLTMFSGSEMLQLAHHRAEQAAGH